MAVTPQHQKKMREGRKRADARRARERQRNARAFTVWVKKDAKLYAVVAAARAESDAAHEARALRAWKRNLRLMPPVA